MGNAQSWTQNLTISNIIVPAATGTPTPTYSASGLPSGISFSASTRRISGTPTGTGSGTITITATNSAGTDTYTIAYSITGDNVPAGATVFRFEDIETLREFGAIIEGTSEGRWEILSSGSTGSSNTGPGSNSSGPYAATDATSGDFIEVEDNSIVDILVENNWPQATNRQLFLRCAVIGAFDDDESEGLYVQGRETSTSNWVNIRQIYGWDYSNFYQTGDTITAYYGDDLTCAQAGGWVDFLVDIPDVYADVRLAGMAQLSSAFSHDFALWSAELRNSSGTPLAVPGTPSTPTLTGLTTGSLTVATTPGSGGAPTLYRWRYSTNNIVSNEDPMVTSSTPNVAITGLDIDADYWIDVRAENSAGNSAYSGDLAATTLGVAVVSPNTPSTPTLTNRTTSSLTLATAAGSGGTPTLYRWRYSTNANVADTDPMVTSSTASVIITGLDTRILTIG